MLTSRDRCGSTFCKYLVSIGLAALSAMYGCRSVDRPTIAFDLDRPSMVMSEMASAVPIGGSATLIMEEDFLAALNAGPPSSGSSAGLAMATRVASLVNSTSTLGVFSEIDPRRTSFSGDLFVVVRDPSRGTASGLVESRNFYLATVRLSGRASWIGGAPYVALDTEIPMPTRGSCGLLEAPGGQPPCPGPNCPPESFRIGQPSLERGASGGVALGTASVPLHVFDPSGFSLWLCQPFEFSPPNKPISELGPGRGKEVCNGLDDNEDGSIDEGDVCANRDVGCKVAALTPRVVPGTLSALMLRNSPTCEGSAR